MTKRESSAPDRPSPSQPTRPPHAIAGSNSTTRVYSTKRKAEEENGVETEENGVRLKVFSNYFLIDQVSQVLGFSFVFRLFERTTEDSGPHVRGHLVRRSCRLTSKFSILKKTRKRKKTKKKSMIWNDSHKPWLTRRKPYVKKRRLFRRRNSPCQRLII